ncbi:MAG: primosomal replication protein N [Rhodocyclaceae bacterium]|nr:MAG: primosomal replication protein N [Rhodocyclaceae bacterium]
MTRLSGVVLERGALRYTPAGIPAIEFRLAHQSEQMEAENLRKVECEMPCVALGPTANLIAALKPGDIIQVGGFLAARSLKVKSPVLHVTTIEFFEGN